jgi:hypothetical protein
MNKFNQARTQQRLEEVLESLCRLAGREIFVMLPKQVDERIPYLKNEIKKTLDLIEQTN